MNTEEKILEILEKLNSRMENLESGQAAVEGHLDRLQTAQSLANIGFESLGHKQAAFEGRMGRLETALTELQGTQTKMQEDLAGVKLRLELDIEKRFNAVNEGIDSILEKLTPKSRVDELEADVIVLKSAIKMLSQEVAELKKAQ